MRKRKQKQQKQTAVRDSMLKEYEKQLAHMSDKDFDDLIMAIPPKHPMVPAVYQEHQKRSKRKWQELMDNAPSDEMREMAQDLLRPETFERFLRETNSTEGFQQLCQGDEALFEETVSRVSERTGRMNERRGELNYGL
jgi:hypothetical protein